MKISIECTRFKINYRIALQVGALKIYAMTVEALKKKERHGETQFATKTEVPPPLNANVFLITLLIKLTVLVLFSLLYR
jgi:hypothetical protein